MCWPNKSRLCLFPTHHTLTHSLLLVLGVPLLIIPHSTPRSPLPFTTQFKVNTLGAIHSVEAFLPLLRAGATKKVIFISSGGAVREVVWKGRYYEAAAYSVTKSAENMVMTKYAAQLEAEGFTVASICPGTVDVTGTLPQPSECFLCALWWACG